MIESRTTDYEIRLPVSLQGLDLFFSEINLRGSLQPTFS